MLRSTVTKSKRLDRTKMSSVNYTHIFQTFQIFCCKLEIAEKILLLIVNNVTLLLRFMKRHHFYYAQTAMVVNSKRFNNVSNFVHSDKFLHIFLNPSFLVISL